MTDLATADVRVRVTPPLTNATYDAVVEHVRQAPVHNRFRYDTRMWLVDLDRLPTLPRGLAWLTSFRARDHLGDPSASLRANVDAFLATQGIDLTGGRVLMLANARALGHAFNPISIHWCYTADGRLAVILAEVHNTYGDRHVYVVESDPAAGSGDAVLDKQMYVSPFNSVDGSYRIRVSNPGDRIAVSVTLQRPGQPPFVATLNARRRHAHSTVVAAAGAAVTSMRVGLLIRVQGIGLWRRGMRIEPRPHHPRQKAVS